jgi:hypothetical protein
LAAACSRLLEANRGDVSVRATSDEGYVEMSNRLLQPSCNRSCRAAATVTGGGAAFLDEGRLWEGTAP